MEFALHALSPLDGRYARTTQPFRRISRNLDSSPTAFAWKWSISLPWPNSLSLPSRGSTTSKTGFATDLHPVFGSGCARDQANRKNNQPRRQSRRVLFKRSNDQAWPGSQAEYVHFGLTSQDINNTAIPLSIKEYHEEIFLPALEDLLDQLRDQAKHGLICPCWPEPTDNPPPPHAWAKNGRFLSFDLSSNGTC
jgi:adenylosuccinate lyase